MRLPYYFICSLLQLHAQAHGKGEAASSLSGSTERRRILPETMGKDTTAFCGIIQNPIFKEHWQKQFVFAGTTTSKHRVPEEVKAKIV